MMRFTREHLILKALAALREVAHIDSVEPIPPSMAVRFALAYLYSVGSGDRSPFDGYWREMIRTYPVNRTMCDYLRGTMMRTHLMGIARSVGYEMTAQFDETLTDMICTRDERQRRIAQREAFAKAKADLGTMPSGEGELT